MAAGVKERVDLESEMAQIRPANHSLTTRASLHLSEIQKIGADGLITGRPFFFARSGIILLRFVLHEKKNPATESWKNFLAH